MFALTVLVACGDSDTERSTATLGERTGSTEPADSSQAGDQALRLADAVAHTPAWAQVRRFGPAEPVWLKSDSPRFLATLVGVERGPVITIRTALPGGDPPAADIDHAYLLLLLSLDEDHAEDGLKKGDVVAVPVLVWRAGAGAPQFDDVMNQIEKDLRSALPAGARALVYADGVSQSSREARDAGAVATLELPKDGEYPALGAVTFETGDRGLVSLDVAVGDDAETYMGVTNLGEAAKN